MPFLEDVKAKLAEDVNYTDGISTVPLTQSADWVQKHFSKHGGYARLDDDEDWVIGEYESIEDGNLRGFEPVQAGLTASVSRHKFPAGTPVVPINVDLYDSDVIPENYIKFDEHDDLKGLLGALSKQLSKVRSLSDVLTTIQDPDRCPPRFLDLIAESFGWELKSETVKGKRIEVRNIIEYYRLKGTEKGIKMLAVPTLGEDYGWLEDTNDLDFAWQMRGSSFYFDGARSRVHVEHAEELDLQPPFQIQFWMQPETARPSYLISKVDEDDSTGYAVKMDPDYYESDDRAPRLVFEVQGEDGAKKVNTQLDIWYWSWVRIEVDADEIRLYINDTLMDHTESPDRIIYPDDGQPLWFGARRGKSRLYHGYMDEIKMWSWDGTGGEPSNEGLVGYWRLDELRGEN